MATEHFSKQFDADLASLHTRVLQMGGLAEQQVRFAADAFVNNKLDVLERMAADEILINQLEVLIDADASQLIARRQPAAGDLRMVMGIIKAVTDIERVGDEASKIARIARDVHARGRFVGFPVANIRRASELASEMLHKALDAFARLDCDVAAQLKRDDAEVDIEFQCILRLLITHVMEDPRNIGSALDMVLAAKAIERIGDHAKNIAEYVVYIAKGTDIRHTELSS